MSQIDWFPIDVAGDVEDAVVDGTIVGWVFPSEEREGTWRFGMRGEALGNAFYASKEDAKQALEEEYARRTSTKVDTGERIVVNEKTGGAKGRKLAIFGSIPTQALHELAEHYGKGEAKYPTGEDHIPNWRRGYEWSSSFNALCRHLNAFWGGEDIDAETGSKHIIAVAWHALTLATFMDEHPELDDRPAVAVRRLASTSAS